ncbi:MAG: magnesium/cobalt transporter CorA [Nitrospirales bacterium]|nr:magnesium/cobalt transporter CorA [Nitrospirales bacterium]
MQKVMKERSRKAGLPPGSLVHIGEKTGSGRVSMISYGDDGVQKRDLEKIEDCIFIREAPVVTWINLEGVHDVEGIRRLGDCFGFHQLILEDILNTDQRPKVDDLGEYMYIVLKMLRLGGRDEIDAEQVSLILGRDFLISFQEGREGDVFNPIRESITDGKGKIRQLGADYLAYSLMDALVDNYFLILERLGERVETLEAELVSHPSSETLSKLYYLKREMLLLRKAVWPLRDLFSSLERRGSDLITDEVKMYFRDVHDHTIQVMDVIETYREMLSGMLDIYLTGISNRLNEVMKVLTIIATIFMPLTFIAGVYGMTFQYMPELRWRWGYPVALLVMLIIGVAMLILFRRKRWL